MIWNQRIVQLRAESGMTLKDIADQMFQVQFSGNKKSRGTSSPPAFTVLKIDL